MPDPIQRRNPHRAVGETNQDAINRLAGERAAALADADRLRSEVAALRGLLAEALGYAGGDEPTDNEIVDQVTRVRSEVAALRAAGDAVIEAAVRHHDDGDDWSEVRDRIDAWRSAAGSPATAQPPAAVLRGLLAEARGWVATHPLRQGLAITDLLRRIDAATTDDAQEGQR